MIANLHHPLDNPCQQGCATLVPGARNTTKQASSPLDSGIFSRPNTMVFGLDAVVRKAIGSTCFELRTSSPPVSSRIEASGFQFNKERETMTTTTPKMGNTTSSLDIPRQQAAIENALSMALYFMRLPRTDSALHAATTKTNRALRLLKNACSNASEGDAA